MRELIIAAVGAMLLIAIGLAALAPAEGRSGAAAPADKDKALNASLALRLVD